MTTDAEDRSTWPRNGKVIRRAELLRLIEERGTPWGLDLRGAIFVGGEPTENPADNPIDLSPEAVRQELEKYRKEHEGEDPPWWQWETLHLGLIRLEDADLSWGHLEKADLREAQLEGAQLFGTHLEGACLNQAHLEGAVLGAGQLKGAYLDEAHLEGADLTEANLEGVWVQHAHLEGARLEHANLERGDLREAHFEGANLRSACLQEADLRGAYVEGACLYSAKLADTRVARECLGRGIGDDPTVGDVTVWADYRYARETYLTLKANFRDQGRYEDASWAYVKEQQMEKATYFPTTQGKWWIARRLALLSNGLLGMVLKPVLFACLHVQVFLGLTPSEAHIFPAAISRWRWFRNWFYELSTGYGERPWNPVIGGGLIVVFFAGGFCATGTIANFWDALIYSLATFATFNLGRPGLNPEGRGVEIFSSLEAILGIGVLALVVFTVGNRMSRG
ncbi:MAG: pentapeptide repeat-containing protein [Dehalococcoidia bacterium]